MKQIFQSVRWRLQIWHALILLGVVTMLCLFAYRMAADEKQRITDHELESFEKSLMRFMWDQATNEKNGNPPSLDEIRERFLALRDSSALPVALRGLFDPASSESPYLVVWDSEGEAIFRSANTPARVSYPFDVGGDMASRTIEPGQCRELIHGGPRGFRSLVGRSLSADMLTLATLRWKIAAGGTVLWLFGLLGGWWLSGRAIQPVNEISRTASRIAHGDVSERINLANTDSELGRLSQVLNETFDRLEASIRNQRQFTADASHELRTPLTVILSETTRGLKRDREAEDYREILSNCHHAATRMRSLVESLLILARQDGNHEVLPFESLDLASIAADAVKLLHPLAEQKGSVLESHLSSAPCLGDPRAVSMVAVNLISNAIDHQWAGGKVVVKVFPNEAGEAVLEVADQGPGIAPDHLPRLFDRFYRIDAARGSANGHSGLGLAIVKAIVDNHRGSIEVVSKLGQGALFRVKIPATAESAEKTAI